MPLTLGRGLTLPEDAITQTFAILAKRRAGKSNAAVVMAEEMHRVGLPFVVVDPKGDWWGMRAKGTGPGLPIPVFGGEHADIPLEPTAGTMVASLVAEKRLTAILDLSDFSKAQQIKFLVDFFEVLYRKNRDPLHVFLEEADEYVPQRVMGDMARLVGAVEKLVKRGGFRGLGMTLISQRSASINKDALTQIETLIVLRTTSPQDRDAIKRWVETHEVSVDLVNSLPSLGDGEAWLWSPHWLTQQGQEPVQRGQFRRRRTFDSGATPNATGRAARPSTLADIDLDDLRTRMAETIERAKAEDPKELRRRIADLERDLHEARAAMPEPERVEVPVLTDEDRDALQEATARLGDLLADIGKRLGDARLTHLAPAPAVVRPTPAAAAPAARPAPTRAAATVEGLAKAEGIILTVLAPFETRTKAQISRLSGYSIKSSGFKNSLSSLRTKGLIVGSDPISITEEGRQVLGPYDPLPTGPALREQWMARLGKAEKVILTVLAEAHPSPLNKAEISERSGYSMTSSGFKNALSALRSLELASGYDQMTIAEELV